ncbi:MAG: lytic murein transglycosylase B [Proteobacteria bacterium]|nr:lytic murein transglycosylase B [Pseudomonadota bacterium]HQR02675.1 lytic murein transglycosylase B [Rhodocyclaceae bacterium]
MTRLTYLLLLATLPGMAFSSTVADSYADRPEARTFAADMEREYGIPAGQTLDLLAHARPVTAVLKAIQPPANPAIRSWRSYRSRFVEPRRIAAGLRFWQAHAATLARAEAEYGVPQDIVVAIIGVETIYGKHMGRFQTLSALATLAFDYPPRAELFRHELESLLLLAREQNRSVLSYQGSYAGALGLPQFLPSSERRYAVDFDGDGKVDLATSAADAIGSVAHFLAEHGWEKGGPILTPATVSGEKAELLLAEGIEPKRMAGDLAAFGVEAPDAPVGAAALIDYVTPDAATEYRLGYHNFYVITRYNRSSFYATAVADLAEALRQARGSENRVMPNAIP